MKICHLGFNQLLTGELISFQRLALCIKMGRKFLAVLKSQQFKELSKRAGSAGVVPAAGG